MFKLNTFCPVGLVTITVNNDVHLGIHMAVSNAGITNMTKTILFDCNQSCVV